MTKLTYDLGRKLQIGDKISTCHGEGTVMFISEDYKEIGVALSSPIDTIKFPVVLKVGGNDNPI